MTSYAEDFTVDAPDFTDAPAWKTGSVPAVIPAGSDGGDAPAWKTGSQPLHAPARVAESLSDLVSAGWQRSSSGLIARGKLPDVELDPQHSAWYERAAAGIAQTVSDLPAMVVGGLGGGAAGTAAGPVYGNAIGAGAGAMALPALIRESLMQYYDSEQYPSSADFLDRAAIVLKATGKDALVGGLTGGAGKYVAGVAPGLAGKVFSNEVAATAAAKTMTLGAEVGTMTVSPALLEGRLPEPEDFLDAAILIGGFKAAGHVAGKLRSIYARTGATPAEIVADARTNPEVQSELVAGQEELPVGIRAPEPLIEGGTPLPEAPADPIPTAYRELASRTAAEEGAPNLAQQVLDSPFADLPEAKLPTQINLKYLEAPDDVKAFVTRTAEVYQEQINRQRGGTQSWEQTEAKKQELLRDLLGAQEADKLFTLMGPREPGTAANAVELSARGDMLMQSVLEATNAVKAYTDAQATGVETAQMKADALTAIHRSAMIQADFTGAAAEVGRALQYMKRIKQLREQGDVIKDLTELYGGDPEELIRMFADMENPSAAARAARGINKATTWDMIKEAYKAFLVSGPVTQAANLIGNASFAAARPLVDGLAATIGAVRGNENRLALGTPAARFLGNWAGVLDGMKAAWQVAKSGETPMLKGQPHINSIPGPLGTLVRLPFRGLSAGDALFQFVNQRGEAWSLAYNQAIKEGFNPATREFIQRAAEIVNSPTPEMQKAIEAAGLRFTFNSKLGPQGQAVVRLVREWKLDLFVPFTATPGNVFKELARLSPLAPAISEWRAEVFKKGGPAADRALAEFALGSMISAAAIGFAKSGLLSGAGDPDPNKRRVQQAAGWQPYSIKTKDGWVNYQRIQPLGTLLGMASDMAEVHSYASSEDEDMGKAAKMVAVAFANSVTNQTFLQGISTVVKVLDEPDRYGARAMQSLVSSAIPFSGFLGQEAQMHDQYVRETYTTLDAIKNKIPVVRESLLPKRDVFGEPVAERERPFGVTPFVVTHDTEDKVRQEAARLGVSVSQIPKSVQLPAGGDKRLGKIELTPEQRDSMASMAGKLAYDTLKPIVADPSWDKMPDMYQKRVFSVVFDRTRELASKQVLEESQRRDEIQRIVSEIQHRAAQEK